MGSIPGIFANPICGQNKVLIFRLPGKSSDSSYANCMKDTIESLHDIFGLDIGLFSPRVDASDDGLNFKDSEETPASFEFDSVIECLLGAVYHSILNEKEWSAFSIDGQMNGVFCKSSTEGNSFMDVVAIKGFTINADGKTKNMIYDI